MRNTTIKYDMVEQTGWYQYPRNAFSNETNSFEKIREQYQRQNQNSAIKMVVRMIEDGRIWLLAYPDGEVDDIARNGIMTKALDGNFLMKKEVFGVTKYFIRQNDDEAWTEISELKAMQNLN